MSWIRTLFNRINPFAEGGIVPEGEIPKTEGLGVNREEYVLFVMGINKTFRHKNCLLVNRKACAIIKNYDKPINTIILN